MKLINTRYYIIENQSGRHTIGRKEINWRNVAILVGIVGLIAAHLGVWYL